MERLKDRTAESAVVRGGRGPLPRRAAARAVFGCMAATVPLLLSRRTHLRRGLVGTRLQFADGTRARVFRETTVDGASTDDPCLLVVKFRLRLLRGRWHRIFLVECIMNTPLFVGFPGFVSKLWLDRDEHDSYRGLYEWRDSAGAEHYARSLWRVLQLVCTRGSIDYCIVPRRSRAEVLQDPGLLAPLDDSGGAWCSSSELRTRTTDKGAPQDRTLDRRLRRRVCARGRMLDPQHLAPPPTSRGCGFSC